MVTDVLMFCLAVGVIVLCIRLLLARKKRSAAA
jgi:hypothetical protein